MSTPIEIVTDIIVNHEKQTFAECDDNFKGTVLEAVNRANAYLYNYSDWTFRVAYYPGLAYDNATPVPLPTDFLSFNQTGAVFWNNGSGVQRELVYKPLPEVLRMLNGPNPQTNGNPWCFSIGGPLAGTTNQRQIFIYPNVNCSLNLIYEAISPQYNLSNWEDPIKRIPPNWHYVIRELAIIFRLIDKEGDSARYQEMLKTCMKTMLEQEPHGREATNISLPKKLWWRLRRR